MYLCIFEKTSTVNKSKSSSPCILCIFEKTEAQKLVRLKMQDKNTQTSNLLYNISAQAHKHLHMTAISYIGDLVTQYFKKWKIQKRSRLIIKNIYNTY